MSELKAFTFGLGQYTEDGSPCVVAFDGEKNPRLASDEKFYLKSEADKVIAELEEERRWRKCCEEMPEIEEGVGEIFLVVVENESNTSPKGSYVTIAELCDGEWYNDVTGNEIEENIEGSDYFYRSKVTHWMPLPSAPKEEK